jgi:hypothetical protein
MGILKGTKHLYSIMSSDILADNIKMRLEYGFLEIGGYTCASFNNSSTSGLTNLKGAYDNRHTGSGLSVFEGLGSWVWETGAVVPSGDPSLFRPSGVSVGATFYPTASTSGTYAHYIDYLNGRVVFDNPIPANSSVKCEYCFRDVNFYLDDDIPWRRILTNYIEQYEHTPNLQPSGLSQILKQNRIMLPCVVIEAKNRGSRGLQLGGGEIDTNVVVYHIFSDSPSLTKNITDKISEQGSTGFRLFNSNSRPAIYNYDGSLSDDAEEYKNLINPASGELFWTRAAIVKSTARHHTTISDIYVSEVAHTIEVERYLSTY